MLNLLMIVSAQRKPELDRLPSLCRSCTVGRVALRTVFDQKPIEEPVEDPRERNHWGLRLYPHRGPVRTIYTDFDDDGPWIREPA